MSLRRGIVVATHPQDYSVDLVMSDNGARLVGVQVLTPTGSTRTGSVDLPHVPPRKNKWDITEETDQEMIALVGTVNRCPVVVGFLYPQINQMLSNDPNMKINRHQSDVSWMVDGEGNIQLDHPGGAYIRIGETPDQIDTTGKNADANSKADRNTGRKVNVRIGLADNMVEITLTPQGDMTVKLKQNFEMDADGHMRMTTKKTFDIEADGNVTINTKADASVISEGKMTVTAGGDITATSGGNVSVSAKGNGTVTCATATITAPGGTTINSPLLRVNGEVSAKDYHKG